MSVARGRVLSHAAGGADRPQREAQARDRLRRELARPADAGDDSLRIGGEVIQRELAPVLGAGVPGVQVHLVRTQPAALVIEQRQSGDAHEPVGARRDHGDERDPGVLGGERGREGPRGGRADGVRVASQHAERARPGALHLTLQGGPSPDFRHGLDPGAGRPAALQEGHGVAVDPADQPREVCTRRDAARRDGWWSSRP